MNRRQAITATATAVAASFLRPGALGAQSFEAMAVPTEGETLYLSPLGSDADSGTRERPLMTLAAAAQRVNESKGSGAMTIVLSEGVYAVGEQATFKPDNRTFTKSTRLTIRAEVLPSTRSFGPCRTTLTASRYGCAGTVRMRKTPLRRSWSAS